MPNSFVYLINGNVAVHVGYFANSVDPDQPASSEAGWSGFTLFAWHAIYAILYDLVDFRVICIYMLKIASDGNFCLLFGKSYLHLAS